MCATPVCMTDVYLVPSITRLVYHKYSSSFTTSMSIIFDPFHRRRKAHKRVHLLHFFYLLRYIIWYSKKNHFRFY